MKNVFEVVFVIIGTIIGAGFASGQEVYIFFFSHGVQGIIGIILSSTLIGIIIYKSLKIIKLNDIKNYNEFLDYLIKNRTVKQTVSKIVNIFILISFFVMIAGFGAYLSQEYKINSIVGSGILAAICYMILKTNIKGFVKTNKVLIPILIIVIVIIRAYEYKKYKNTRISRLFYEPKRILLDFI